MKRRVAVAVPLVLLGLFRASGLAQTVAAPATELRSPGTKLSMAFVLSAAGEPTYRLTLGEQVVLRESRQGLEFKDKPGFTRGFVVERADTSSTDESVRSSVRTSCRHRS